jgi:hypothetical protein
MATLREYFDTDLNKCLSVHKPWGLKDASGNEFEPLTARISQDFDANAKYWSFYIPAGGDVGIYVNAVFQTPEVRSCVLGPEGDGVLVMSGFHDYSEQASSETLVFTNRVFMYLDYDLSQGDREAITKLGKIHGFYVTVRDREYAAKRSAVEKPLAFISHDSRDKDELVRELAQELSQLMCPVWYDEYSLRVGASLRESIETGLKETRNCIVVLSPNFLSNKGWGKAEFDSVFTREILEKQNVMLPVWHNVTVEQVYEYSPRLADKVGLNTNIGVKELARRLSNEMKRPALNKANSADARNRAAD